jgi:hypothetical protein
VSNGVEEKTMMAAAMLVLMIQATPLGPALVTFSSHAEGARWEFVIPSGQLDTAPLWHDSEEHPPLAPRAAVQSARQMLSAIVDRADEWELAEVTLHQIGQTGLWVYKVKFLSPLPNVTGTIGSALRSQMDVIVLLDGTAIRPVRRSL